MQVRSLPVRNLHSGRLFFVAHFLGIWFHFQAQHQLGPLHTYRAPDHLESGSAWRALRSGFIRQCGRWGIGPPQLQTPRRAILAIPTTTHNNLQFPARGCAFLKNAHYFPSVSVWQYVPALVRYVLRHFAVEVIYFCVMQHQQQHHPPSGTEINAAPASDKWRTGSETKSHRQRKTFVCACSMISPLSYFTSPMRDIWRDPLFRMELGGTTDVSSISTRSTF